MGSSGPLQITLVAVYLEFAGAATRTWWHERSRPAAYLASALTVLAGATALPAA